MNESVVVMDAPAPPQGRCAGRALPPLGRFPRPPQGVRSRRCVRFTFPNRRSAPRPHTLLSPCFSGGIRFGAHAATGLCR